MNLQDFDTLAIARGETQIKYSPISPGKAGQFFGTTGMLSKIEAEFTNPTLVQLLPSLPPTTVGELCRTIIKSSETIGFAIDPNTPEGDLNRAGAAILVNEGIISQGLVDAFFGIGETVTYPFANKTEYDFAIAKGTVDRVVLTKTANGDSVIIQTSAECELHSPRITNQAGTMITRFFNVSKVGFYTQVIPNEYKGQTLYVDNAFNVVT
jgi:hypothetical protein